VSIKVCVTCHSPARKDGKYKLSTPFSSVAAEGAGMVRVSLLNLVAIDGAAAKAKEGVNDAVDTAVADPIARSISRLPILTDNESARGTSTRNSNETDASSCTTLENFRRAIIEEIE
jgi:hypothetical protein